MLYECCPDSLISILNPVNLIGFCILKMSDGSDSISSCSSSAFCLQEATITVTEKGIKEVMDLEDETFSKFYRAVEELPASINMVEIDDDFDTIFGPQAPK